MKFVPSFVLFALLIQTTFSKPLKDKEAHSNIYIVGNIRNAAMSHINSKSQAVSDRNNSEWNHTQLNKNNHRNGPKPQTVPLKEPALPIPEGRDAANIALANNGSKAQAAGNDKKSKYNHHNIGITSGVKQDKSEYRQSDQ